MIDDDDDDEYVYDATARATDRRLLAEAAAEYRLAEGNLQGRLWIARKQGWSWKEIAEAMGSTQKWAKAFRPNDTPQRREPLDI